MNFKRLALSVIALFGSHLASAQSTFPIDTDVMVNLTASGTQTNTYEDGSIVVNQISVNLQFHPYSPQPNGPFFTSASADFNGTITLNVTATETDYGFSDTEYLKNQLNYTESGYQVDTGFFGPQFQGVNPGNVSSLFLDLPTTETQNPEPFALYYDGTNSLLTVGINLPAPFGDDNDICTVPCTATVTGNGSSFTGMVQDASTGKPLAGATVIIGGQTLTTGATGIFFAPYLVPGPLKIQITVSGYATFTATEPLAPFSNVQVPFPLKPTIATTLKSIVFDAPSAIGGSQPTATVYLTDPAPAGGAVVNLTASTLWPSISVPNPNVISAPASVTVQPSQLSVSFTVDTDTVNYPTYGIVVGSYNGVDATGSVTVIAQPIGPDPGNKISNARVDAILNQFITHGTTDPDVLDTDWNNITHMRNQCDPSDPADYPPDRGYAAEQDLYLASAQYYLRAMKEDFLDQEVAVIKIELYNITKLVNLQVPGTSGPCTPPLPPSPWSSLPFHWAYLGTDDAESIKEGESPIYP
ncbi:MAG TPA: carboxypeptidase-like regulatory domain-containing protein [Verrucomicrobiae bacterium]|jgi:hypothetical protein